MWQLAINSLFGRRLRSALLAAAVALATALIVAMGASIDTLGASIQLSVGRRVGLADVQIVHQYNMHLKQDVATLVRGFAQVQQAAAAFETGATVTGEKPGKPQTVVLRGVEPDVESRLNPLTFQAGRAVQQPGEAIITPTIARKLGVAVGDTVTAKTFKGATKLTVVGVIERPKLDVLQKRLILVTLQQVRDMSGTTDKLTHVDIQLRDASKLDDFMAEHQDAIASASTGAVFRPTAAAATRVNRGIRQAKLMLAVISALVFLSAGFIILTGMTSSVLERMRELAILRSVGAGQWQIAGAQLLAGAMLAGGGALLGVAPGLALAYWLYRRHANALEGGFSPSFAGVSQAVVAAMIAGLAGALYPAWRASQANPVQGLSARAKEPTTAAVIWCFLVAIPLIAAPVLAHQLADVQHVFWAYIYGGLPLMFVGYFLLTVPLIVLLAHVLAPPLAAVLRVPGKLLREQILATPFRLGFTGGALMVALAMLVAIWTAGSSVMKGWFDQIQMPDGFAHSFYGYNQTQWQALNRVSAVTDLCPSTAFPVMPKSTTFGVASLAPSTTLFVSTDLEAFLRIVKPRWIEGDPDQAAKRLSQGGALLVTEQYLKAHGLGAGDKLTLPTLTHPDGMDFDIVGVVTSPGLQVAVRFFDIQRAFGDAAVASVIGSRQDAAKHFNVYGINLVLLDFDDALTDTQVLAELRAAVPGVIVGSSRVIRKRIHRGAQDTMAFFSTIAGAALAIACLGVGQLIFASLAARWFEMGVLRTIGASPGLLGRLVAAQTIVVAITASITGAALGVEMALIHRMFHQRLFGISYDMHVPWSVVGAGAAVVLAAALGAALPSIARVSFASPRRLLAAF